MACLLGLVLHYCGDAGHIGFLQNADVGAFVLPADPQNCWNEFGQKGVTQNWVILYN